MLNKSKIIMLCTRVHKQIMHEHVQAHREVSLQVYSFPFHDPIDDCPNQEKQFLAVHIKTRLLVVPHMCVNGHFFIVSSNDFSGPSHYLCKCWLRAIFYLVQTITITPNISWELEPPGHQAPWCWLCLINGAMSLMKQDVNYMRYISVAKW